MAEDRDIYQAGKKADGFPPRPRAPRSPKTDKPPHRKAIYIIIGMVLLMGAAALYFYSMEASLTDEEAALLTNVVSGARITPSAAAVDTNAPEFAAIESLMTDIGSGGQALPPTLSPQKMAEAMAYVRSAQEYARQRNMDAAEREVGKALVVWPDMNIAIRLLGSIYTQRGQFDQAIILLERSLAREPFSAETLNNLAINYMQKGMVARAEELLMTSLQVRPDYPVAYLNLAFVHLGMNRFDLAAENFELGLRQMPNNTSVLNNLAVCFIRMGDYESARKRLNELIELAPNMPIPYFNMAIVYIKEGRQEPAMEWLRRGADLCSPSQLQNYLADPDLNPIRNNKEFEKLVAERFPDISPPAPRP